MRKSTRPAPLHLLGNQQELVPQPVEGLGFSAYLMEFRQGAYDSVGWHWHTETQFCVVLNGSVEFQLEKYRFFIQEGEGLWINSGVAHRSFPLGCEEAVFLCVDLPINTLCPAADTLLWARYFAPVIENTGLSGFALHPGEPCHQAILQQLLRLWQLCQHQRYGYELRCRAALWEVWATLAELLPLPETRQTGEAARLKQILSLIEQHYAQPLTLEAVAKKAGLSRSECSRYFRKATGQTLFRYLIQYRLEQSARLLRETDHSLAQIAAEVGFGSQSHYTDSFHREKGCTPLQYRLAARKEQRAESSQGFV